MSKEYSGDAFHLVCSAVSALITVNVDAFLKEGYELTDSDVIESVRRLGDNLFGDLFPKVFNEWGIKNNTDVKEILKMLVKDKNMFARKEIKKTLTCCSFSGSSVLETLDYKDKFHFI